MSDSTRPPNKPPTAPPPSGPPKVPTKADDLFALADAVFGPMTPARQSDSAAAVGAIATPGGPVKTTCFPAGEEPTPGSVVALSGAARKSTGAVVAPGAGVKPDSEGGHAGSPPASGVVSGFTLPRPLPVPSFAGHLPGGAA